MRAAQHLGGAGAAAAAAAPSVTTLLEECEHRCRWRAYSKSNELEADGAVVLIVLLCCLICAVALNAAIRCFLRGGGEQERNDHDSKAGAWRLAVARTVEYREGMEAECAICLSEFEEGEAVHVLETCKHAFHVDCIEKWFRSRPSCPTCRCSCPPPPESDPELGINPAHQVAGVARNH